MIFADTADILEMKKLAHLVSGFTTNPTLMRKAGVSNYMEWAAEVCRRFPNHEISLEVIGDDFETMERQAVKLAALGNNVYVKIPVTLTDGTPTIGLIRSLWNKNIKVNITAVMTYEQVDWLIGIPEYGSKPTIMSIFSGRIADTGGTPEALFSQAYRGGGREVRLLWASTRELGNLFQARHRDCQADIITLGPDLISKFPLIGKDLKDYSRETVQQFYDDAKAAGYTI